MASTFLEPLPRIVSVAEILDEVSSETGVSVARMTGSCREARYVRPLHFAMALAVELTDKSLPTIARLTNRKDHTTVISAVRSVAKIEAGDGDARDVLQTIRSNFDPHGELARVVRERRSRWQKRWKG